MNELKAMLLGIDPGKQILDLWLEMYFNKALLSKLMEESSYEFSPEDIERARKFAIQEQKKKFTNLELYHQDTSSSK